MSAERRTATKRAATATAGATARRSDAAAVRSVPQPQSAAASDARPSGGRSAGERPSRVASSARQPQGEAKRDLGQRTERVRKLYRETVQEIKRVNWPDQETTRNLTIVVIGISVVLGILLGGIDFVLLRLLELF